MSLIQNLLLGSVVLLLIACGGPPAPTDEEVKASLALEFPSHWQPVEFRILGSPRWSNVFDRTGSTARFEATMELVTPTYLVQGESLDELLVEEFGAPGDRVTLSGRAQALRREGGWDVQFFLDENPTHGFGRTMDSLVSDGRRVTQRNPAATGHSVRE
jgi:hypothetical protein